MTREVFFALLTIRLLNLKFEAAQSWNPDMVVFENDKGNKIYITKKDTNFIEVSVYKVTARCYNKEIDNNNMNETIIESIAKDIKEKLKLKHDIKV